MRRALVAAALFLSAQSASADLPIVGGWYLGPGYPSNNGVVVTFFDGGIYYMAEDGVADSGGGPGMERGTYVFDQGAKTLTTTTLDDTSGDWGLSDATVTSADLVGDTLTVTVAGEPFPFPFTRIADPANPIVGSWYAGPTFPHDDGVVLTLLSHGNYFLAEDGVADAGGGPGMERGDFSWDGANNLTFNGGGLRGIPWRDTNGDWGFSDANVLGVVLNGDRLTMTIAGEGDVEFMRIPSAPIPEPETYALMLAGLALLAAAARRKQRR